MKRAMRFIAAAALAMAACGEESGSLPPCDSTGFVPVVGGSGLYSYDQTPDTSLDVLTYALPALTDGVVVASAGISLGPDGDPFQNVGVDMGGSVPLDALRIHVRTAAGNLVPTGGPVSFDIYTSADAVMWFPAVRNIIRFDVADSYYEMQFVEVTVRFFKAVSFGTNTSETFVTEIQALLSTDPCSSTSIASEPAS